MDEQESSYNQFDDLKCIWMSSNLVEYKLCDKDFDCENCEFDKVMRNQANRMTIHRECNSEQDNFFRKLIDSLEREIVFRKPPYYYLKNNLIVKNLFGNIYYIGINPAVLLLLDCQNSVRFLTNGDNYVQRGVRFLKIQGEWGSVDIASPIAFLFLNKTQFESFDYFTNEWFGLIEADNKDIVSASYNQKEYEQDLRNIKSSLNDSMKSHPETGVTMMDGGRRVRFLHEAIGKDNYSNLIHGFFRLE